MIYTTDEIRQRIAPVAEKYQLRAVYLFGSYARNEATDDSDIDILVDLAGSSVRGWVIGGVYNDLNESIGKNVDMVTVDALNENKDIFSYKVMRERVLLYEKQ